MTPEQLALVRTATPAIPPVDPAAGPRPFWSVVIPAFERTAFLEESLGSVLRQAPGPERMQIEVVDDASSTDAVEQAVARIGGGRVGYVRQPETLGQFGNVNAGLRRARGRWIHVLHDDDWVEDGFYARLEESLGVGDRYGAAMTALHIRAPDGGPMTSWRLFRSDPGLLPDAVRHFAATTYSQPPAIVVRRDVYELLGGFRTDWKSPGDWEMWQRIAAHFDWLFEPRVRACYRAQVDNNSDRSKSTGRNLREAAEAIAFAQTYLPAERAAALRREAEQFWAEVGVRTARRFLRNGQPEAAAAQLSEALRLAPTRETVARVIRLGCPQPRAP